MTRNVAASVRAKLASHAKDSDRPFQEVLQYYGLERFLYRLSRTRHASQFLLKGALMLRAWGAPGTRPTRDIDLLGYVSNEIETLETIVRDACNVKVQDDGVRFDDSTVVGARIKEGAEYEGIRLRFTGYLENARVPMQLDVGFGDVVHPAPEERTYPTILNLPPPSLRMYSRETVVAEKFEAMVHLGTLNSRMKDFFDVWLLAREFDFLGEDLAGAIARTFENRETEIEAEPVALTPTFTAGLDTNRQWTAFVRRSNLTDAPPTLDDLREPLRDFLLPIAVAIAEGREFARLWPAGGPWRDR